MALIDCSFDGRGTTLTVQCRVPDGWRRATKTYCFSEQCRVDLLGGVTARVQANVFPVPASLSLSAADYGVRTEHQGGDDATVSYALDPLRLRVNFRLWQSDGQINKRLPWDSTRESGKLCLKWEEMFYDENGRYRVSALIVFNDPPNAPPRPAWEKGDGSFSGGLPSLGKRR